MRFLAVAVAIVAGAVALAIYFSVHPLIGAVAGVNLATLALYGYDKAIAGGTRTRVPEKVLHLLALAGGSPGALIAQTLFRHKTVKASFQRTYWLIVLFQLTAIGAALWYWRRPPI
jgi:uncharacterized membrane protein YsdA (DUF1294 family)